MSQEMEATSVPGRARKQIFLENFKKVMLLCSCLNFRPMRPVLDFQHTQDYDRKFVF